MVERNGNGTLTADQRRLLKGYVEEIERYEDQIDTLKLDVKGAYEAAAESGFDTKALKKVIADRKKDAYQLEFFEVTVDAYRMAIMPEQFQRPSLMIDAEARGNA